MNQETGFRMYDCPQGRFVHIPPGNSSSTFDSDIETPWWRDLRYQIGSLTRKPRMVRITNTLTHHEEQLQVPSEESLNEILNRYEAINLHAKSYTWKDIYGKILDMDQTLEQNGIVDEDEEYDDLEILDADRHIPVILLYFNDDLTEA